jgi:TetR/AcrR family transcriptional repressor of lmrAB and yxaGH operons
MGPRERLIDSTISLIRRRGVHATGLTDLLQHSGTARQSIYQHFPGGKAELVEQATLEAGRQMAARFAGADPVVLVDGLIDWWEHVLNTTSFASGCPVVSAALASSPSAGTVFQSWEAQLAAVLSDRSLASFVISAVEGAVIQSRARRSTRPLDDARVQLTRLLPLSH